MVNLNDVAVGDTLTFKGRVMDVARPTGWINGWVKLPGANYIYFDIDGQATDGIEAVDHEPRDFDEPTGAGAVVRVAERTTQVERTVVRVSEDSWMFCTLPNGVIWPWDTIVQRYRVVEVISEGVEL